MNLDTEIVEEERSEDQMVQVPRPRLPPPPERQNVQVSPPPKRNKTMFHKFSNIHRNFQKIKQNNK